MAKNVFKPAEIVSLTKQVKLESPFQEFDEPEELDLSDEYLGPTADDLRREAEQFKKYWESEKKEMLQRSQAEAEKIVQDAETTAQAKISYAEDTAKATLESAEQEASSIIERAQKQAEEMIEQSNSKVNIINEEARSNGFNKGREEGYENGKAEMDRLIEHLRTIISKAIEKRSVIIDESEKQIIELVLLICKKVVKVISENQNNVVINNVVEALRKLKNKGEVTIRVHIEDAKLTNEHIKDFLERFNNVEYITVLEDSSVDKGGCIVETDFGRIDARISSQLREIEEKILDLVPMRTEGSI